MLRRDRQLRTQMYQLKDAALFALGLWLAHWLRFHTPEEFLLWKFNPIAPFDKFVWLYLIIIPGVPLVLRIAGLLPAADVRLAPGDRLAIAQGMRAGHDGRHSGPVPLPHRSGARRHRAIRICQLQPGVSDGGIIAARLQQPLLRKS